MPNQQILVLPKEYHVVDNVTEVVAILTSASIENFKLDNILFFYDSFLIYCFHLEGWYLFL